MRRGDVAAMLVRGARLEGLGGEAGRVADVRVHRSGDGRLTHRSAGEPGPGGTP